MDSGFQSHGVSIVIPHYGDPALTRPLIKALLQQTTQRPLQIIVADDHSPEPFPELNLPGCVVVRREVNGGFGSAVNSGAAHAVHPLLLILNSDLTVGTDFVETLCAGAEPWMPAFVSPTVVGPDGSFQYVGRKFPKISRSVIASLSALGRWRNSVWWHRSVGHEIAPSTSNAMVCDWFVGAAILAPTAAFRRLGGFDERFHMNSEEIDLQRRAREFNLPSIVLSAVSVEHAGGGSSDDAMRFQWLMEGEWRYWVKWNGRAKARAFQASMLGVTLVNLVWNILRALFGRSTHPVRTFRQRSMAILRASAG